MKKSAMLVSYFCLTIMSFGEMSETRRGTADGIEWLYTIDESNMDSKSIVLEKAVLLTASQYDLRVNFANIVMMAAPERIYWDDDTRKSYLGCEWHISIGASAFEGNEYLTQLTFEEGYWQEFENTTNNIYLTFCVKAFKNCSNLSGIYCNESSERGQIVLKSIEESAFEGCGSNCTGPNIKLFSASDGYGNKGAHELMSTVTNVGARAFYGVRSEANWESFYDAHFAKTGSVVGVSFDSLENLGEEAFAASTAFGRIKLPASQKIIKRGTFKGYEGEICLSSNLEEIEGEAFMHCRFIRYVDYGNRLGVVDYGVFLPDSVVTVGEYAFAYADYVSVKLSKHLKNIGEYAFYSQVIYNITTGQPTYYSRLEDVVVIPNDTKIGTLAFYGHPKLCVIFEGTLPYGIAMSDFDIAKEVLVPIENLSFWAPYFRPNMKFAKKVDGEWVALGGKVISNSMRPSDPTIMDIKYKVTSTKDKVNVRILAFEDGNRSFAKVLRPETFVDGTEANVGDGVAANVEHTISWQVSKDWDVDLAKVSIEVYVQEDNLLPLQLTTIPAMGEHAAVTFSRNVPDRDKVMNALYWLYADKAADLTLANGVLKCGDAQLVNGSSLSAANAVSYIYSKMGYGTLSGDTLKYVNELMRTNLNPSGIKQYAVKEGVAQ